MYDLKEEDIRRHACYQVQSELNERGRTHLKEIARRGERSARKVKRALVLLGADGPTKTSLADYS